MHVPDEGDIQWMSQSSSSMQKRFFTTKTPPDGGEEMDLCPIDLCLSAQAGTGPGEGNKQRTGPESGRQLPGLIEMLHQSGFVPGGVVRVNDTLLGSLVQGADSLLCRQCGLFQLPLGDQLLGFFDIGPRPRAMDLVNFALSLVAANALDSRRCICQVGLPPLLPVPNSRAIIAHPPTKVKASGGLGT
jgi:hypothetical protein